jgi:O-antigen/teichoic acid export membrane protein
VTGRFALDTAATQAGLVVSALCAFATSIILWRGLGQAEYGRYALVFALYGLVNILGDVGLGTASISRVAEARGAQDAAAFVGQTAYLLKMTVVIGAAVTAVGVVLAPALARLVYGKPQIGLYARLLFVSSFVGMGRGFTATLLAGMRRMRLLAGFNVAFAAARLAAVGGAVAAGLGLWGVVGAHVAATLVISVLGVGIYRRSLGRAETLPGLGALVRAAVRAPWRRTFKLGALVTLDRQLVKLVEVVPVLVLGRFSASAEPAGYFNLARNVMRNLGLVFSGLAKNLLPFFSELKGKGQLGRLWRDYRRAVVAGGVAALVVAAVCVPVLPAVLAFFYGEGRAALAAVAYVLLAKFAVDGFGIGLGAFVVVAGKVWWSARVKLVSLPIGLGVLIGGALAGRACWEDPLVGAAMGAAAGYAAWWIGMTLVQLAVSFRVLRALATQPGAVDADALEAGALGAGNAQAGVDS